MSRGAGSRPRPPRTVSATDTIAAIATPPGRGGIGIVRVSGPATVTLARKLLGTLPAPRHAAYMRFLDAAGAPIDEGLALFFPGPHSFTGEDVLELHGHGGPVIMDLLLQRVLELGARLARPGEFSERAFLNGKLDLAQAEAVADLIDSGSAAAARGAVRSLQGEFSLRVEALVDGLIELRTWVEAAIDFPEEEIDFLDDARIGARLASLRKALAELLGSARQGALLRDGLRLVIAGRPNAGKSSLLNALAGYESAIVTDVAGTTRDVLREHIEIDGLPVHVVDTAGLHESSDPVEQEGIRRAWREIEGADHILLLADAERGFGAEEQVIAQRLPEGIPLSRVLNKIDLSDEPAGVGSDGVLRISATRGLGLADLREHLKAAIGYQAPGEGSFVARRRHLEALRRAGTALERGTEALETQRAGELLAEDLRAAQEALGEITGAFTSEDLLGRIFASFCIGK